LNTPYSCRCEYQAFTEIPFFKQCASIGNQLLVADFEQHKQHTLIQQKAVRQLHHPRIKQPVSA